MIYLTETHRSPPAVVELDGLLHPTAPLIERDDTARLAELGIHPHVTAEGEAPLGYTDWVLTDGTYYREPAGTQEEIDAALALIALSEADALRQAEREANTLSMVEWMAQEEIAPKIIAGEATADIEDLVDMAMFPYWKAGVTYEVDQVLTYDDALISVVQAHTSQIDWRPEDTPALYTVYRPPGYVSVWVQPTGAQDAYAIGERVTHDRPSEGGAIWIFESKIDANVEEPGRDGTFDRWWEPISVV